MCVCLCVAACLCVYLCVCLPICQSVCVCVSVCCCLPVCLSIFVFFSHFLWILLFLSFISLYLHLYIYLSTILRRIAIDEERLVLAFGTLDVESKGYLDADAIRRAMGAGISNAEVAEMIAEVDVENTGRINYIDFIKFWRTFILSQNISPLEKFIRVSKERWIEGRVGE